MDRPRIGPSRGQSRPFIDVSGGSAGLHKTIAVQRKFIRSLLEDMITANLAQKKWLEKKIKEMKELEDEHDGQSKGSG
jgi:hypothetical protein